MKIDEQIIHTTIRIISERTDGLTSTGTGFFYMYNVCDRKIPVIVTNKHVLEKTLKLSLKFSIDSNGIFVPGDYYVINIDNPEHFIINHPDSDVDLCLIKIDHMLDSELQKNLCMFFLNKENIITEEYVRNSISNIEEIYIVGYPNGIIDKFNNLPIVRKGITATSLKYDFNNKKEFLIDSAIYIGSSGSPVFIFNQGLYSVGSTIYGGDRLILVGIVYAVNLYIANGKVEMKEIPIANAHVAETYIPNNLGVVIKACRLIDFDKIIDETYKNEEMNMQNS